ncbi:4-keto-6-deoxy-N-Acetyl-D-hexosaminyl-(Lipid carrier) aminotransferase [Klebsiella variicola]|nr:4-keto-6-deoxy-N-Acetyl-D-hexosaminyl-(Lipid carrier) aminotransferase [Klebsiella variicola]
MIPFNAPPVVGTELDYMQSAMNSGKLCGDGGFTAPLPAVDGAAIWHGKSAADAFLHGFAGDGRAAAGYPAGRRSDYAQLYFVSTANAFVLRGAKIVFVDIRRDTMNIDETLIEAAITDKTRAIVPVHYAGVACEMDTIMAIADKIQPVCGGRRRAGGDVYL